MALFKISNVGVSGGGKTMPLSPLKCKGRGRVMHIFFKITPLQVVSLKYIRMSKY